MEAYNNAGTGQANTPQRFFVPHRQPDQVNIQSTTHGYRNINVNWDIPNDNGGAVITTFNIHWGRSGITENTESIPFDGKTKVPTNYKIMGLEPDTNYVIAVSVQNRAGAGPQSEMISIRTSAGVRLPSQPEAVTATAQDIIVNVSWMEPARLGDDRLLVAYRVYWSTFGVGETSTDVMSLQTSYRITGLTAETDYQVSIAAVNPSGEGERSEPLTLQTLGYIRSISAISAGSQA